MRTDGPGRRGAGGCDCDCDDCCSASTSSSCSSSSWMSSGRSFGENIAEIGAGRVTKMASSGKGPNDGRGLRRRTTGLAGGRPKRGGAERDRRGASNERGSSLLSSLSPTPSHKPDAQRWRIQAAHEHRSRPTLNLARIHATHMASRAAISSACGTASFVVWLFAQSPQILTNYRRGSVDGLSLVFLAQWMAGDVTNLLGCLLTDQLTFQKLTAAWFCIVDMVLMGQYIVYSRRDAKRRAIHQHHHHHRARSRSVLVRTDSTMEGVYTALFSPSHHHAHHRHHSKKRSSRQRPPRVDLSASVDLPAPALPSSQSLVRSQSENRVAPRPSRSRGSRLSRTRSTLNEEARKVAALLAGQMSLVRSAEEGQEEQEDYFVCHHPHHYPASGSSRQSSRASSRASSRPTSRSNSRSSSAAASPKLGFHHRPHGTSSAHRHLARLEPLPRIDSLTEAQVASVEEARRADEGAAAAPSTSAITIRPVPERSFSRKKKAAWGILSIIGLGSLAGVGTNAINTLSARMVDGGIPAAPVSLLLGRLLSWLCTLLYLTSRLPQIYENHTRRSVAGLSILLFISAFLGNSLYAISILTSPLMDQDDGDGDYFRECMPFLLGSAGTLVFDAIILGQWMAWGGKEDAEAEARGVDVSHDEEDGHAHHDRHHQRGRPPRKHYGTMTSSGGGVEQTQVDAVPAARDVGD